MEEERFHLDGDGHGDAEVVGTEVETPEQVQAAYKKLADLKRDDGVLVRLGKQELGLLKQMLHAPEENTDDFIKICMICDFLDEDEANRELDAFYEADRLGMSIKYNIAHALSRVAINRKGAHHNSRVATLGDILSHQKITSNTPSGKGNYVNPRSPLA